MPLLSAPFCSGSCMLQSEAGLPTQHSISCQGGGKGFPCPRAVAPSDSGPWYAQCILPDVPHAPLPVQALTAWDRRAVGILQLRLGTVLGSCPQYDCNQHSPGCFRKHSRLLSLAFPITFAGICGCFRKQPSSLSLSQAAPVAFVSRFRIQSHSWSLSQAVQLAFAFARAPAVAFAGIFVVAFAK